MLNDVQDVSVVIPTRNCARTLPACLESVSRERPAEIIGVDMQSTDATILTLREHGARILQNPTFSLGYSRQLGVNASKHSFVMFVDSDISLTPGCISTLLSDMMRSGWDGVHASVRSSCNETYWQRTEDINISLFFNRPGASIFNSLAAALFKRQVLLDTPFDANFIESNEDVDLSRRLVNTNHRLGMSSAVAYHFHRRDFPAFARQRFRGGLGRARMYYKYGSIRIIVDPLISDVSRIIRNVATRRVILVPYWVAGGIIRFAGTVVGLSRIRRQIAERQIG